MPPTVLIGEEVPDGMVYDAQEFLAARLKLTGDGALRAFHRTDERWGAPGEKPWISTTKKARHSHMSGPGFYVSTASEERYGKHELRLELPVRAFAGKKILETRMSMPEPPEGVDILAAPGVLGRGIVFVFRPESEEWLNRSATVAAFDRDGEVVGWS